MNGEEVTVNNQVWIAEDEALAITPTPMQLGNTLSVSTNPAIKIYPTPDLSTRALVESQLRRQSDTNNVALSIAYPLANGTYDVFFTLAEGQTAYSRDVRATIEGNIVARAIGNLALGEWVNYGPYRTTVNDGILNMDFTRETKGSPKIAKFSIYQAEASVTPANGWLKSSSAPGIMILSWPSDIPASNLETSTDLGELAEWGPTNLPTIDFTDTQEVHAPTNEPRRFFRLKLD